MSELHCSVQFAECRTRVSIYSNNGIVRQRSLRSKDIGFILHTVFTHIKDIKFFETTGCNSFLAMKNIVSDFVPQYDLFHNRVHTVFEER